MLSFISVIAAIIPLHEENKNFFKKNRIQNIRVEVISNPPGNGITQLPLTYCFDF